MFKKINNYHIFILIIIVFILNTILFRSIDITKAQWSLPGSTPGEQETNIVINPLQEDLDLGGQSIFGEGNININGNINAFNLYDADGPDWAITSCQDGANPGNTGEDLCFIEPEDSNKVWFWYDDDVGLNVTHGLTVGSNINSSGTICDSNGCIGDGYYNGEGVYYSDGYFGVGEVSDSWGPYNPQAALDVKGYDWQNLFRISNGPMGITAFKSGVTEFSITDGNTSHTPFKIKKTDGNFASSGITIETNGDVTFSNDINIAASNGEIGISNDFAFRDTGDSWLRLRKGVGSNSYGDLAVQRLYAGGSVIAGDIDLTNEHHEKPNEVDGTRGSWTIQEGANNLFLINRNTGEKYEFMLKKRN